MSYYVEVLATHRPFPYGLDEGKRTLYSANFSGLVQADCAQLEEEIIAYCVAVGIGSGFGVDWFIGPLATMSHGDGPYSNVIATAGLPPVETHNTGDLSAPAPMYESVSFQIITRAKDPVASRERALAIWRRVHGVRNAELSA